MFVQEAKQDYCRFTVAFRSDCLCRVQKPSIVLGDASDKRDAAFVISWVCAALKQ